MKAIESSASAFSPAQGSEVNDPPTLAEMSVNQRVASIVSGLVLVIMLSACGALLERPTPGLEIEDDISVCLSLSSTEEIMAYIRPGECYSFREYHPRLQQGVAVVNEEARLIRFQSSFILEPVRSILPKIPDCGGGGQLGLNLGRLPANEYQLFSAQTMMGQVVIPGGLPWCSSPRQP